MLNEMFAMAETGLAFLIEELGFFELLWSGVLVVVAFITSLFKRARDFVIGSVRAAIQLYVLGRVLHPEYTLDNIKCRLQIMALWFTDLGTLRAWFGMRDNPRLQQALKQWPRIQGAVSWPYIHCRWPMAQRLRIIDQHYRVANIVSGVIASATTGPVELARLDDHVPGLRLVLDKANWYIREGEVVLNLFVGERRLMAIAFSLSLESGRRVAYVGALQGAHASESLDTLALSREITHALHGVRPRDFLVIALRFLCQGLGVANIYAVSNDCRHHRHKYFGNSKTSMLHLNYDDVWSEHGGTRREDGFFRYSGCRDVSRQQRYPLQETRCVPAALRHAGFRGTGDQGFLRAVLMPAAQAAAPGPSVQPQIDLLDHAFPARIFRFQKTTEIVR